MVEITKDVRKNGLKALLDDDNLVLIGDSWEEVELRHAQWKKAVTKNGLKVTVKKTKAFCTNEKNVAMVTSKLPCSVCR